MVKQLRKFGTILVTTALTCAVGLCIWSCSETQWRENTGAAWGTTFSIKYQSDHDFNDSIVAVMRQVEMALSQFEPQSNISRVNRGETDTLNSLTSVVFIESRRIAELSGGMFDPTVAPLVNMWGFGPDSVDDMAPDSAKIAAALERVGIAECSLNYHSVLRRKHPQTTFDFSAIAKGFGVDCVADMLRRNGVTNFFVEIGGEVHVGGLNPQGEKWVIQVDAPDSGQTGHKALEKLYLTNMSVASSGNYRNYRDLGDGRRVGHTISPKTGHPITTEVVAVTVIAPNCMTADAMCTAAMAMDGEAARLMIDAEPNVSGILVMYDGEILHIGAYWNGK